MNSYILLLIASNAYQYFSRCCNDQAEYFSEEEKSSSDTPPDIKFRGISTIGDQLRPMPLKDEETERLLQSSSDEKEEFVDIVRVEVNEPNPLSVNSKYLFKTFKSLAFLIDLSGGISAEVQENDLSDIANETRKAIYLSTERAKGVRKIIIGRLPNAFDPYETFSRNEEMSDWDGKEMLTI
jgi:hypothetical protein